MYRRPLTENKNIHHVETVSQVYSVSYLDSGLGVSFSREALRNCSEYPVYICDFYEGVPAASGNILSKLAASHKEQMS